MISKDKILQLIKQTIVCRAININDCNLLINKWK